MKKICFFVVVLFAFYAVGLSAQDWSMPQDNKPKKVVNWATPMPLNMNFDYPFEGYEEYDTYLGTHRTMHRKTSGTYTLRIPNRFKGTGILKSRYGNDYTWAIGEPDASAGYREVVVSYTSGWYHDEHGDHGDVVFNNDVVINGAVAFDKGPQSFGVGYMCYSEVEGCDSDCIGSCVQYVKNPETALYYQFVKAYDDSSAIILWGIFSTSSRYSK